MEYSANGYIRFIPIFLNLFPDREEFIDENRNEINEIFIEKLHSGVFDENTKINQVPEMLFKNLKDMYPFLKPEKMELLLYLEENQDPIVIQPTDERSINDFMLQYPTYRYFVINYNDSDKSYIDIPLPNPRAYFSSYTQNLQTPSRVETPPGSPPGMRSRSGSTSGFGNLITNENNLGSAHHDSPFSSPPGFETLRRSLYNPIRNPFLPSDDDDDDDDDARSTSGFGTNEDDLRRAHRGSPSSSSEDSPPPLQLPPAVGRSLIHNSSSESPPPSFSFSRLVPLHRSTEIPQSLIQRFESLAPEPIRDLPEYLRPSATQARIQNPFFLRIRDLNGEIKEIGDIMQDSTLSYVKSLAKTAFRMSPNTEINLIHNGKKLNDDPLNELGIKSGDTLNMTISMRTGSRGGKTKKKHSKQSKRRTNDQTGGKRKTKKRRITHKKTPK